jgi:hypothetical protein
MAVNMKATRETDLRCPESVGVYVILILSPEGEMKT